MNKSDFLTGLGKALRGLPQNDIDERLTFYSEMIDDRIEEGLTEEEAVSGIGSAEDIAAQIVAETSVSKIVKEKVRPKRTLRAWEIVLLVLGSPIWLSLLIALFSVVLAVYITIWSVIIAMWAAEIGLALGAAASLVMPVILIARNSIAAGIALVGASVVCGGLAIFLFFGCKSASGGLIFLTKKMLSGIKSIFIGRRTENE